MKLFTAIYLLLLAAENAAGGAPYGYRFTRTDNDPAQILYDRTGDRFFISVPGKNEIEVVAAESGKIVSRINAMSPYALDLSPDGATLYVTSYVVPWGGPLGSAEGFCEIDTSTLEISAFVQPVIPADPSQPALVNQQTAMRDIAAMRNGKIFYTGVFPGVTSSSILAYDPATGISTPRPPDPAFYDGILRKSADGSRVVLYSRDSAGGDLWVYDSDSDAWTAHTRLNNVFFHEAIPNADGTRVLVDGHLMFDQNLQQIADMMPGVNLVTYRGSAFAPDGSHAYLAFGNTESNVNPAIAIFDIPQAKLEGYVPAMDTIASPGNFEMSVGSGTLALLLNDSGFAELDLSAPLPAVPATLSIFAPQPALAPQTGITGGQPVQAAVNGVGFTGATTAFFGDKQAANVAVTSTNAMTLDPPASGIDGPVDITIGFPNGWAMFAPESYTYGPFILYQDVNAGSTAGGTTVNILGYGFDGLAEGTPGVTVGGVAAKVQSMAQLAVFPKSFPLEQLSFVTPPGKAGFSDITITTANGTTTAYGGYQYLPSRQVPNIQAIQMVLDSARGKLYAADAASGAVQSIDLGSLAQRTLVSVPGSPATGLALTPDTSHLLVISAQGGTVTVFDLNAGTVVNTFIPVPGNQPTGLIPNALIATSRGTALVGTYDSSQDDSGAVWEVDLQSGNAKVVVAAPVFAHALLAGSADGSMIYMAPDSSAGNQGGDFSVWSAASDTVVRQKYILTAYELAASAAGDVMLADTNTFKQDLSQLTSVAYNALFAQQRLLTCCLKLHASGSLQYVPTTKGVEIYDVHRGDLLMSLGVPGGVATIVDGLAIDDAGGTLYVAETAGIGIFQLNAAPLSIGRVSPQAGSAGGGGTVTVLGTGFQQDTRVWLDAIETPAHVLNSTALTFVAPPVAARKVTLTVANPVPRGIPPGRAPQSAARAETAGPKPPYRRRPIGDEGDDLTSYTLPLAYDASVQVPTGTPSLASVSTVVGNPVYSGQGGVLMVNGSGFVTSSQIMLNGLPVHTVYASAQELVGHLYSAPGAGPQNITVMNPGAGGGVSNAVALEVLQSTPNITSLAPSSVAAGSGQFSLHVVDAFGDFVPQSVVLWNGAARSTTFVSSSHLIAQIAAADVAAAGTATVAVSSPAAAGGSSITVNFTITAGNQ